MTWKRQTTTSIPTETPPPTPCSQPQPRPKDVDAKDERAPVPFVVHRYGPGRDCSSSQAFSSSSILGRMPDGFYEVEVITYKRTGKGVRVLLRQGALLHSELVDDSIARRIHVAVGWKYPQGGVLVVGIKGGTIDVIQSIHRSEEAKPMEHY